MASRLKTEFDRLTPRNQHYIKGTVEEYRKLLLCSRYGDAYNYMPRREVNDSLCDQTYRFQSSPNELLIEKQTPMSKKMAERLMDLWMNWTEDDELFLEKYQVDKYHVVAAVCTALPDVSRLKDFNRILLELLEFVEMDEKFAIEILQSVSKNQVGAPQEKLLKSMYYAKCKPSDMLVFATDEQINEWKKTKFRPRTEKAFLEEMKVNSNVILTLKARQKETAQTVNDVAGVLSVDMARDFAGLLSLREDSNVTDNEWKSRMEYVNECKEKILNMMDVVRKQIADNEILAKKLQNEDKRLKDTVPYEQQMKDVILEPIVEMNENLEFQTVPLIRTPTYNTFWSELEGRLNRHIEEDSDINSVNYNENESHTIVLSTSTVSCGSDRSSSTALSSSSSDSDDDQTPINFNITEAQVDASLPTDQDATLRSSTPANFQQSDEDVSSQLSPSPPNSRESSVAPLLQANDKNNEVRGEPTNKATEGTDVRRDDRSARNQPAPMEEMNDNANVDSEFDDFWNDNRQYLSLDEIRPETILRDIQIKIENGYEEVDIPQEHLNILLRNNIPIPNGVVTQSNSPTPLPSTSLPDDQLPEELTFVMNIKEEPVEERQPVEEEEQRSNSTLLNVKQEPVEVVQQPVVEEAQTSTSTFVDIKQEPVEKEKKKKKEEEEAKCRGRRTPSELNSHKHQIRTVYAGIDFK
ncbi:hypothetical protein M3Y98_00876400 [Aphelenchoides besseyi]|nr:hypothetical protein M3Y98_00876400 [Aphelenchoides besseyi]